MKNLLPHAALAVVVVVILAALAVCIREPVVQLAATFCVVLGALRARPGTKPTTGNGEVAGSPVEVAGSDDRKR